MGLQDEALRYHTRGRPGKIEVTPTKPLLTQRDLALAYSPGVAAPVLAIAEDPDKAFEYTAKGNLVAVLSNGSAILGLGDLGPLASKPVMEGKGVLFKRFADVDVFDIEVDTTDPDELVRIGQMLAPTFGGINLEDIKAPECFYVERELERTTDIPIFHDDQHGTAIISGAALINALELVDKKIEEIEIVVNGAGAAGIACAEFYVTLGARREHILLCDSRGVIWDGREEGMNEYKARFANDTDKRTLADALDGADVFVGVSVADIVTPEMLRTMARDPIVFALANPDPEIDYALARETRDDVIMATGRSDFPNQVNNVLGFPFIFRGALDVRATNVNAEMKAAAAMALAELTRQDVPDSVLKAYGLESLRFSRDYIIPKPLDPRVLIEVAPAVARAAMESGVARKPIDLEQYGEKLHARQGFGISIMRSIVRRARRDPRRLVFTEGEEPRIIRAAYTLHERGIAQPLLLGNPEAIHACIEELQLPFSPTIIDPASAGQRDRYAEDLYQSRKRKGVTWARARELAEEPNYFGSLMVAAGDADALISGLTFNYPDVLRPALQVIGTRDGTSTVSGVFLMVVRNRAYFFSDATVNIDPTAEDLAAIAINAATVARTFNIEPRVAMISYSNFGSTRTQESEKVRRAVEIVRERDPELLIDGEMQADTAVVPELVEDHFRFSRIKEANVLVFPNLDAANASYKLLSRLGGAEALGPILHGMAKPVHVIPTGAEVRDIVNMAALAVLDAQRLAAEVQPRLLGDEG
jgi:malate dehydrogenase (oxaloacetate-decarboxylating)(NADP+)